MMYTNPDYATARSELLSVANAVIDGREYLLEGVRKICALRVRLDPDHEAFMPIRAVESETDHFPVGSVRSQYRSDSLAKADDKRARYLGDARDDILAACREIIRVYS